MPVLAKILANVTADKKLLEKIAYGLSMMDKSAEIQRDRKGNIIYDKETKDTEKVRFEEAIDIYMEREVLPHIPDAKAFFEENLESKNPIIKTGAEIIFTRMFYEPAFPESSVTIETTFEEVIKKSAIHVSTLFQEGV